MPPAGIRRAHGGRVASGCRGGGSSTRGGSRQSQEAAGTEPAGGSGSPRAPLPVPCPARQGTPPGWEPTSVRRRVCRREPCLRRVERNFAGALRSQGRRRASSQRPGRLPGWASADATRGPRASWRAGLQEETANTPGKAGGLVRRHPYPGHAGPRGLWGGPRGRWPCACVSVRPSPAAGAAGAADTRAPWPCGRPSRHGVPPRGHRPTRTRSPQLLPPLRARVPGRGCGARLRLRGHAPCPTSVYPLLSSETCWVSGRLGHPESCPLCVELSAREDPTSKDAPL